MQPAAPPKEAPFDERALFAASRRRARAVRPVPPPPPTRAELAALAERALDVGAFAEELARVDEGKFAIRSPLLAARDLANFAAALGLRRVCMAAAWRALAEEAGGAPLPDNGAAELYAAVVRAAARAARGAGGAPAVIGLADAKREFELTTAEARALPVHYSTTTNGFVLAAAQEAGWRKHGSRDAILRRREAKELAWEAKRDAVGERRAELEAALSAEGVDSARALQCNDLYGFVYYGFHAAAGLPALVERGRRYLLLESALDGAGHLDGGRGRIARTVGAYLSHVRRGTPSLEASAAAVSRAGALIGCVVAENGGAFYAAIPTERPKSLSVHTILREAYFAPYLAGNGSAAEVVAARFMRRCRLRICMRDEGLNVDEGVGSCASYIEHGGSLAALVATMRAVEAAAAAVAPDAPPA